MVEWWRRLGAPRRRALTGGGLAVAAVAAVTAYGVIAAGPVAPVESAGAEAVSEAVVQPSMPAPSPRDMTSLSSSGPALLPRTAVAEEYAGAVAAVLFGMDHRTYARAAYQLLLTGARSPRAEALIPDVTGDAFAEALQERIPDEYMWERMRDAGQWSTFAVSRVWEPDYIAAKRATGELPDGVVGLNVAGTQTLHYLDENGDAAVWERGQSVSLLLVCAPVQPDCGLITVSTGVVE